MGYRCVLVRHGEVQQHFFDSISDEDCIRFRATRGVSDFNTLWEAIAMLVAIRLWMPELPGLDLRVKSDNLAALSAALKFKAHDPRLNAIAREMALDVCEGQYELNVLEHIPGISNKLPDALSRLFAPEPQPWPVELNLSRCRSAPARGDDFWRTWGEPSS